MAQDFHFLPGAILHDAVMGAFKARGASFECGVPRTACIPRPPAMPPTASRRGRAAGCSIRSSRLRASMWCVPPIWRVSKPMRPR